MFTINNNYYFFSKSCLEEENLIKRQELLIENIGKIMTQTTELAAQLQAVAAQFEKAMVEVKAQTAALEAALANVSTELPVEAVEALAKLQTLAQNFDDLNPDPVLEPVVNPEPVVEVQPEPQVIEPELVVDQPVEPVVEVQPEEIQPQ